MPSQQLDDLARNLAPSLSYWLYDRESFRHWGSGSAFPLTTDIPSGLAAGDRFWRSDLGLECYYDLANTRWLTMQSWPLAFGAGSGAYATNYAAATASIRYASIDTRYQPVFTYGVLNITTGATNTGANYLSYSFVTSAGTTIWTVNTSADAPSTTIAKATATFTQPPSTITSVRLDVAIGAGAPSAQFPYTPVLYYRMVIP